MSQSAASGWTLIEPSSAPPLPSSIRFINDGQTIDVTSRGLAAIEDVLDRAWQNIRARERVDLDPPAADRLTRRELEVLRLLADGRSDPEIAAALFISRRTAATHVSAVFHKLGVTSRAAAAAYAVRHGLA